MKRLLLTLTLVFAVASSQTVRNVRVVDHVSYILKVIQDTISEVEHREWCNLKLPDITMPLDETVIDRKYHGTVTYTNGFVVSIQHVDVQQSTVQQVWSVKPEEAGIVFLQGTLRMTDLVIGYDVVADTDDGRHRYTATFKHPLISFAFKIDYNSNTDEKAVTVVGTVPKITTVFPEFFPKDSTSAVLTVLFDAQATDDGIKAWGPDVFQPICTDVITSLDSPRICYDCPIQ